MDYDINLDELLDKYVNKKPSEDKTDTTEKVLESIKINGIDYFYDNNNDGLLYNDKSEIVGRFKNNKALFD